MRSPNVHEIAWHHYQIAGLRPLLACCARTPWIHWLPAPVQPLKVPKRSAKSFKTYCFVQFLMVSNLESKSILHNFSWFCSASNLQSGLLGISLDATPATAPAVSPAPAPALSTTAPGAKTGTESRHNMF